MHVHIGNLAAKSGASLFLHTHVPPYRPHLGIVPLSISVRPWVYNKTENLARDDIAYNSAFTHWHVITKSRDGLPGGQWKRLLRGLWRVLEMKKVTKLFTFERYYG